MLIALGDANHPHRAAALQFFQTSATVDGWATCPLTENAFIRILGGNNYPGSPGSTAEARRLLNALKAAPGHQFWPDDLSFSDFPSLSRIAAFQTSHRRLPPRASRETRRAFCDSRQQNRCVPRARRPYGVSPHSSFVAVHEHVNRLAFSSSGLLVDPSPVFDWLKTRGGTMDGEYILIAGTPVQILMAGTPLVEEALREAFVEEVAGVPARVFTAEHLAAIALEVGRAKDKARVLQFIE